MKLLTLIFLVLNQTCFALAPEVKGVKKGTCINAYNFGYSLVQLMAHDKTHYVYEVAGNYGSPRGVIKTKKKFDQPGPINMMIQYVGINKETGTNGFPVMVDVWEDCK